MRRSRRPNKSVRLTNALWDQKGAEGHGCGMFLSIIFTQQFIALAHPNDTLKSTSFKNANIKK